MRVEPWHQTPWDWRAGVQFCCGGTGTGLLFFTALAARLDPAWLTYTGWLALLFICIGLFFVWIKLGRRWRAMFVILNPRTSWMSREALLSLPLLALGAAAAWFRSPVIALLAAIFSLAFLYAQAQMLKASRGIPAWREPLIVPLIFSTGLTEGASLLLMATAVLGTAVVRAGFGSTFAGPAGLSGTTGLWLPGALFLFLVIRLWVWVAYLRKLCAPGAAPAGTAAVLNEANRAVLWPGHLFPLALLLLAFGLPATASFLGAMAGLVALLAGWFLKFTIVARAAYNQGFALAHTPARTPGYGGPGTKPGWNG
jgi:phenylacetyl-CoA:acceptor oxidoreductase subunit 2